MGLDGGRSIGMPKSSSERSSKSEFSDSEFVFGGVKFNGGIDMGEEGGERDRDLGGDGDLGGGEGDLGGGGEGEIGGDGDLGGGDYDVEGCGDGDLGGWGSLPIFPSKESCGREWRGNWYCRGNHMLWRGGSGGGGLCLFCQARRVLGESGGGIGIAGEPAHCSVSVFFS